MDAIVVREFGGPEVLRLETVPDPSPAPGHVAVRVHAVGVNPVETYIRTGSHAIKPTLPYIPGSDAAGVIDAVGEGVTHWQTGQRVYTSAPVAGILNGAYAGRVVCEASRVHGIPDRITYQQAAGVNTPYATAARALLQRGQARPGETVLVHGASGGVGIASVQIARALGLVVIGTAGTDAGLDLVRAQGAHHAVSHRRDGYVDEIIRITGGRGVDVVLEMLANVNLDRDLTLIAPRARICVIGNRGRVEIDPRKAMSKDANVVGVQLGMTPPEDLRSLHAFIGAGLENGSLTPVVREELPLRDARRAHVGVMEPGSYGKIVLTP